MLIVRNAKKSIIPPITSTGKQRACIRLNLGLSPSSYRRLQPPPPSSFNSFSIIKRDKGPNIKRDFDAFHHTTRLHCLIDIIEDINKKKDLGVIIDFLGVNFLEKEFNNTSSSNSYCMPVRTFNIDGLLTLRFLNDVISIFIANSGNVVFFEEIHIPQLSSSCYNCDNMEISYLNGLTTILFSKSKKEAVE